ncbi:hypothetical protein DNK56_06200 [Streptomyces sp. AC1-42W]|nr:hypothetical protein DNK55_25360 [Streptomyces sp. AC1-42T]PZT81730.1 hypothetical protein DNK56_06200 [Streptomyces sp. AC1-42W]
MRGAGLLGRLASVARRRKPAGGRACSPHTRGWPPASAPAAGGVELLPAHAGMVSPQGRSSCLHLPVLRGDRSARRRRAIAEPIVAGGVGAGRPPTTRSPAGCTR